MTTRLLALTFASALLLLSLPTSAQVAMQGSFIASKACPAFQSIKKKTNPGNDSIVTGQSYRLLGKNKEQASHYWIEVPGAAPKERWVAIDCGSVSGVATDSAGGSEGSVTPKPSQDGQPFYVLALSWEPAFCEGLPDKEECRAERPGGFDATHLSLHGLWPQPRRNAFCNVDKALAEADDAHRWEDLPEPALSPETKAALDQVMPGTRSLLERHEWIKHGTCYPAGTAETYFKDAVRLVTAINASPVQAFFAANVGKSVKGSDIRARFDEAFGTGAGERLRIACKDDGGRQLIAELTLGLKGDISAGTALADLIAASQPTDPGCPTGIIDPAELQ